MARQVNKSELIRAWRAENPDGTADDCRKAMWTQHRVKVTAQSCYTAWSAQRKRTTPRQTAAQKRKANAADMVSLTALVVVQKFVEEVGGIDKARAALSNLSKLTKVA